jgi:hypothetical protein
MAGRKFGIGFLLRHSCSVEEYEYQFLPPPDSSVLQSHIWTIDFDSIPL